ncbi:hypothetical protein MN116_005455 [Schistosoma mekongi]|uniref:Uncharacterized protein n=1 Tax=Schistosoma mekongi TaxID=38744 RepID=A0AAE1ZEN6_SCHME|nr:hypothetical protein MN116_005455 [Schistosoma mekongi]
MNFAVGAACYAYRTVGKRFSRKFKILLANSAVVAVLSGFLSEYEATQHSDDGDIQPEESVYVPDDNCGCVPDGEWFYGLWTTENLATKNLLLVYICQRERLIPLLFI